MPLPKESINLPKKLKIGFVLDDSLDRPAGVQQYILTLGSWLISKGHEVHYLVSATKRTDISHIYSLSRNIPARFNGNQMKIPLPASISNIKKHLNRENYDILHVQVPYSPFLAGIIINAAQPQTAVIGTFHIVPNNQIVNIANHLLRILCIRSLRRFDAVVSVSPAAQSFAQSAYHLSSSVIPNAIYLEKFKSAMPFTKDPTRQFNLLFLGKLVQRKGCLEFLKAVSLLKDYQNLSFQVTICGNGPLDKQLKHYVKLNNLTKIVSFAGFVSEADKLRYFAAADLTVFPSLGGESFGIVLLEAMASGRSVVLASDNIGYHTVLKDCPGNVLFDPTNTLAFAEKIKTLLLDPILREHISRWQSDRASDFDISQVGPKIMSIYSLALQRRRNMQ